jgi:phytoene synthase
MGLTDATGLAVNYCRDAVQRGDRDRYLTLLFAPAQRRDELFALAAFNLEIARAREQVSEPMLGLIRLQWWRDTLDGIFAGGAVRRHPVAEALALAIRGHALPRDPFDRLLAARARDMEPQPIPHMAALEDYARDSAAPLLDLMLRVVAPRAMDREEANETASALEKAGAGYALTGLLRALPFRAGTGRLYLPQDRIEAAGLSTQDIARRAASPARDAVVREVADRARGHLEKARPVLRRLPREAAPLRMGAAMACWHLDRLAAAGYDLHAPSVRATPPWTVWRLGWLHLTGGG